MDEQNNLNQELTEREMSAVPEEQAEASLTQSASENVQEPVAKPASEPVTEPAAQSAQATPTVPNAQHVQAPMQGNMNAPVWGQGAPYPYQPPQWYGVSYQGNYATTTTPPENGGDAPKKKKGKFRKVALVALLLVACILCSTFTGVGVYFYMNDRAVEEPGNDPGNDQNNDANSKNPASGDNSGGANSEMNNPTYGYEEGSYNYATAFSEITKNNGSGLANSQNGSAGANAMSMIDAVAAVKDSVVEITTTVESNRGTMTAGAGSGVIIHADGIVVTNNHVIADCDNIYVRLTNGDTYEATLRGTDEEGDIAILKITPQANKPLTVAKLGHSGSLALGEEVIAIGNPLGQLGGTVTNGIISATAREVSVEGVTMTLLQTNAAINSGNSGGGLFNMAGELIGVVNAKYSASGVEGLGFAIPIDSAYSRSIKDLMQVGYIRGIPALGITLVERTGGNIFNTVYGAYVYDPGNVEGLQEGDYIYSIEGTVVYSVSSSALAMIKTIVRSHKVGDTLSVVVLRGEEKITLSVTLTEYVPSTGT